MMHWFSRFALIFKKSPSNRHIWKLSLPVFLSMMTIPIVMITDTVMIGRLNEESIAAATQGGVLFWVVASFFIGVGIGVQVVCARRFGEKKFREAGSILLAALGFSTVAGFVLALVGWYALPFIASLTSDPEFASHTILFTRYRFLGFPLYFSVIIFRGFYDGISKPVIGLIASVLIMSSNVVLNIILIFGIEGWISPMGLKGAAMASTLSAIPGLLVHVFFTFRKSVFTLFFQGKAHISAKLALLQVIRTGMPTAVEQTITNVSFVIFFSIAAIMGTTATAISGVILNVMSLSFMPGYALGTGAATILGQSIARGKINLGIYSVWKSAHIAAIIMTLMGIMFIVFAHEIFALFPSIINVPDSAIYALYIISVFQIADAYQMVMSSALRSAGEGLFVLYGFAFLSNLFFIPLAYVLSIVLAFGIPGLWLGLGLYLSCLAILFSNRFNKNRWQRLRV